MNNLLKSGYKYGHDCAIGNMQNTTFTKTLCEALTRISLNESQDLIIDFKFIFLLLLCFGTYTIYNC